MDGDYEREEDELYQDLASGIITQIEFNKQHAEMQYARRCELEDSCQNFHERECKNL